MFGDCSQRENASGEKAAERKKKNNHGGSGLPHALPSQCEPAARSKTHAGTHGNVHGSGVDTSRLKKLADGVSSHPIMDEAVLKS